VKFLLLLLIIPIHVAAASPETPPVSRFDRSRQQQTPPVLGGQSAKQTQNERASTNRFSRPLLFAPEDNAVQLLSPQIKWDLASGQTLDLGGLIVRSREIGMQIDQRPRRSLPRAHRAKRSPDEMATTLSFFWPQELLTLGTLNLVTQDERVFMTTKLEKKFLLDWQSYLQDPKGRLQLPRASRWGILDFQLSDFAEELKQPFRFCLEEKSELGESMKICSALYTISGVSADPTKPRLEKTQNREAAAVFVGEENFGTRATVNFSEDKMIELRIRFDDGSSVSFSSQPIDLKLLDVVESPSGETLTLKGQGRRPLGRVTILEVPPNHFWSETGVEREVVWQIQVPRDAATIRVPGAWNIPFTYLIEFEKLPRDEERPLIDVKTGSATYSSKAKIPVQLKSGYSFESEETEIENSGDQIIWRFKSDQKGKSNRARLRIKSNTDPERVWTAHYHLYRGYPLEMSARLSGIVSADLKTVAMGEIGGAWWFEEIFGWSNDLLSRRRWGVSTRYFQALSDFAFSQDPLIPKDFSVLTADLRYNLIPGIWNRDELFGLSLSAQSAKIAGVQADLYGVGVYWGRSLPRVFDDLLNIVPLFRYPKYVDTEFIFYPLAMSSKITPQASFHLNFRGKVFWSSRLYGELGFGVKTFDFQEPSSLTDVAVSTGYGTFGIGPLF